MIGAPDITAKTAQPSRKGKKSWRKNIELAPLEDALADQATAARLFGHEGLAAEPDEALFMVDKTGDAQVRITHKHKLPRRIDEFLRPKSRIPSVSSKPGHLLASASRGKGRDFVSKSLQLKLNKLIQKAKASPVQGKPAPKTAKPAPQPAGKAYDVWDVQENPHAQPTSYLEPVYKPAPKKPSFSHEPITPSLPKNIVPAVKVGHPGTSYNPSFDDHQAGLWEAYRVEEARLALMEASYQKMRYPAELDFLKEDDAWDFTGPADEPSDDDAEPSEPVHGNDAPAPASAAFGASALEAPSKKGKRKTQADLNRAKRHQEAESLAARIRDQKKLLKQISNLSNIKSQIKEETAMAAHRQSAKDANPDAARPARLGPHKFTAPDPVVQLTEDLPDCLRALLPEGNLFTERFASLQARNIIEPRVRVGRMRRYKPRTYEKPAYRFFAARWRGGDFKARGNRGGGGLL